jgi:hypothetical protein
VASVAAELGLFEGDHPAAIEVGNEPDLTIRDAAAFAQAVRSSRDAIREVSHDAQIITGGISRTSRDRQDFLARAAKTGFPEDCIIGYHSYRAVPEMGDFGFSTRDAEFERLTEIAGGRPIWCTEMGWHTGRFGEARGLTLFGYFIPLRKEYFQYDDAQVADLARREAGIHARHGARGFVWYQLNDGPDPTSAMDLHGIRAVDGTWKPVADVLGALSRELA